MSLYAAGTLLNDQNHWACPHQGLSIQGLGLKLLMAHQHGLNGPDSCYVWYPSVVTRPTFMD